MKEIVIVNFATRGAAYGIGTYLKELIYCLRQTEIKVNFLDMNPFQAEFSINEEEGVRTLSFPFSYSIRVMQNYFRRVATLLKLYFSDSSDLIFQFNHCSQREFIQCIKTIFPQCRTIFTVHFFQWSEPLKGDVELFHKILMTKDKRILSRYASILEDYQSEKELFDMVDTIISLSQDTTSLLTEAYSVALNKIRYIPNGLRNVVGTPNQKFKVVYRKQFNLKRDEIIILFIGRLNSIKGIIPLLSAFGKIVSKHKNCRLVVIGDGDYSFFSNHTRILSKVIITGRLDPTCVAKWYAMADIGVFPSYYEECSYVGVEMMMYGLPIVASDGYSVRNMFHEDGNALIAAIGDHRKNNEFIHNLSDVIIKLLESAELRKQMGERSRRYYEKNYDVDGMQALYSSLLDERL